ncbi:MAG TPA: hypothetical protein VLV15_14845 [Dongiaceae bacterium]|nr:hypothetical protein [Dongiaceae bacterium]
MGMQRPLGIFGAALLLGWIPAGAHAVPLHAGDLVVADSYLYPPPTPAVWRLDPATLDTTRISSGGLLVHPDRVAVDAVGRIVVADQISGLVSIDPATGVQTLLVSPSDVGGRTLRGVCRDPAGGLYLTAVGGAAPEVLHIDLTGLALRVVTSGGSLATPAAIAVGPGGTLYVVDQGTGIIAVDPSGAQSRLITTGVALQAPFDIAISPDGYAWTAQWGGLSRRGGGFLRTRISDGYTDYPTGDRSQGIAINDAGIIYLGDCISVSLDCYSEYRYVQVFPAGPQSYAPSGGMAVVPAGLTPVHPSTWGSVKTRYR